GSDGVIIAYAFNFRDPDGQVNQDLGKLNQLNNALYATLSMTPFPDGRLKDPRKVPLIITSAEFSPDEYGPEFMKAFLGRLSITAPDTTVPISYLVSTQMDPWLTENEERPEDGFLAIVEGELRKALV